MEMNKPAPPQDVNKTSQKFSKLFGDDDEDEDY